MARDKGLIAVDFDGTLTTGASDPWWEEPHDQHVDDTVRELVNDLYKEGYVIHIWTARRERARPVTQYWLDEWDVMYDALVMEKHTADLFIDDRALNVAQARDMNVHEIGEMVHE